jgi:hypothetical protein
MRRLCAIFTALCAANMAAIHRNSIAEFVDEAADVLTDERGNA